ncbi:MAG: hypothetical protein EOO03_15855 [Chitinophagaceae bacterium]|nr:MAG: hypothetical protein EOO03_15855 [Chitinophagaceae bacterium]
MTTKLTSFLAAGALFFAACNSPSTTETATTEAESHTEATLDHTEAKDQNNDHHGDISGDLQLNNGVKWEADASTTGGIKEMQTVVQNFNSAASEKTVGAYQTLGKNLDAEIKSILNQCRMKGAAHDELHKFMVPLMSDVKSLSGTELEASQQAHSRIQERLALYHNYFE